MMRRLSFALLLALSLSPAFGQVPPPVPALPDTERRTTYALSNSTCSCSVGMQLYGDSTDIANWLTVWVNGVQISQSGNWIITSPTGQIGTIARPITDAVLTFTAARTGTVQIVGAQRPRRTSEYSENRGVSARDLNLSINSIEAQLREMWDRQVRTVQAPPGETLAILPVLASRQNMGACFDSLGNLTSCVTVPSSTFAAGSGIKFTGTNPTTISADIAAGTGIALTGTNPVVISTSPNFAACNTVQYASASVSITSGTAALTVTGAPFVFADVGKVIAVPGAGTTAGGIIGTLITTILSVNGDGIHVTLAANAATTVAAAAKTITYGTDDTVAFQTALSDATTGSVSFPWASGCMITDTLTVSLNKTISGSPRRSMLYFRQLAGTVVKPMLSISVDGVFLRDFSVDADNGGGITSTTGSCLIWLNGHSIYADGLNLYGNRDIQIKPRLCGIGFFGSNTIISNSVVSSFGWYPIGADSAASHVQILNNRVDHGPKIADAAAMIAFLSSGISTAMSDIKIIGNTIDMSDLSVANMNVGVYILGGAASSTFYYDQVIVSNNNFIGTPGATASTTGGVISINTNNVTISGNVIKYIGECIGSGGNNTTITGNTLFGCGTYGIEASGTGVVINGNMISDGGQTPFGMSVGNCNFCTINNNVLIATSAPNNYRGIYMYANSSGASSGNTISNNSIITSTQSGISGVYYDCQAGSAQCINNNIVGNLVQGGAASSFGVRVEGNAGTNTGWLVGPNTTGQTIGISVNLAGAGALCYVAGQNRSGTKTAGSAFPGACL